MPEPGPDERAQLRDRHRVHPERRDRLQRPHLLVPGQPADLAAQLGGDRLDGQPAVPGPAEPRGVAHEAPGPHEVGVPGAAGQLGDVRADDPPGGGDRLRGAQGAIQARHRHGHAHRRHAAGSHEPQHVRLARRHARFREGGHIERERGQPAVLAIGGEAVEERVRRRVHALPGVADHRRDGRQQHEVVERRPERRLVQVPGAARLRPEDGADRLRRDVAEVVVVQHRRQVEHALERAGPAGQPGDDPVHVRAPRSVRGHDVDVHVDAGEVLRDAAGVPHPVGVPPPGRIPVEQREVPGAGRHEVGHQARAEAAEPAGDQVGRRRVEERPPVGDPQAAGSARGRLRRGQHDLALVLAAGHEPQRVLIPLVGVRGDRQRRHLALVEQPQAGTGQLPGVLRVVVHQPVDVDGGEPEVLPEHGHAERGVGVNVDLADLTVPAARRQRLEAQRDVPPGQRVQHHVDARAAGRGHQLVVPVIAVRIERGGRAELEQPLPFGGGPRGRVDDRARAPGQGDRRLADAAHRRVDEHPLARPQPGEVDERVVGRHVHRRDGGRLRHGQ